MLVLQALAVATATRDSIRFGVITDLHYADTDTVGTRFYRDTLRKARDATRAIASENPDFLAVLGDIKDTTAECTASMQRSGRPATRARP